MAMDDGDRQSTRKRTAIVDAATTTFLRKGYLGTSMDEIAALAGVSKQTVYKHFADKERLFSEVVISTVDEASDPVHDEVLDLRDSGDLEADLRDLARRQLTLVMQPQLMQLRRLVIAEARPLSRARPHVLRAGPRPHHHRAGGHLRATRRARLARRRRRRPRGVTVQLARDVGAAQPGDAARRRRRR